MIPTNSMLLSSLERWSRTHSGGFVKAARDLASAKRDLECIENFRKYEKTPSVLHEPELVNRARVRISSKVSESLDTLNKTISDFRQTVEFTRKFSAEISDLMAEELGLRISLVLDLQKNDRSEILAKLLIIISELENFLAAKISAQNFNLSPPSMDEYKNFLR